MVETAEKMRVITQEKYGPPEVLQLTHAPKPAPRSNEIRVQVWATTVTPSELLIRQGRFPLLFWLPLRLMFGLWRPRHLILGHEFSGVIDQVGADVQSIEEGTEVFGSSFNQFSCNADYICLAEDASFVEKPDNLSFEEAAAVPDGACTGLHFLRRAGIQEHDQVLIYGASGSVGTYAVQLAKYLGGEVTAVCSTRNLALMRELGADEVIDYTREDYGDSTTTYDIVFDAVGRSSFTQAKKVLEEDGIFLSTNFSISSAIRAKWFQFFSQNQYITELSRPERDKLTSLKTLLETNQIRPVLDQVYPLDQISEAHRYVGLGHKVGNVVISLRD